MNYEYFDPSEESLTTSYQLDYSAVANNIDIDTQQQVLNLNSSEQQPSPLLGMLCKVLGGVALYSTFNRTFDLSVAAQAGVGAYTILISTVSVGYFMQKMISLWHAFVMTAGLLLASKLFEFNQA